MSRVPTVHVNYAPEHDMLGEVDRDTAVLEFRNDHPNVGPCWVLFYLEPGGNGVEDHPMGGDLTHVDSVVREAEEHLELVHRVRSI